MTRKTLIELIKGLKEAELLPSKKKTEILTNLNDKQVKLFLVLKQAGFITQSNLNYAIGMVSKIKEIGKIDTQALENLCYLGDHELNHQIFQFIVHELTASFDLGMQNIKKLSRIKDYINIRENIYILKNNEFSNTSLLNSILSAYSLIADIHKFTYDEINFRIKSLNRVIEEASILKSFMEVENKFERRFSYYHMLGSFIELIDSKDMDCFEYALGMVSSLARNNKLDTKEIHKILSCFKKLDSSCFGYFESILSKTEKWEYAKDIVGVFNKFEQTTNKGNLSYLTNIIYDVLTNKYGFMKEEIDMFYFELLTILNSNSIEDSIDMQNINDFIIRLISPYCDFINYYKRNGRNIEFIKCAFASGLDYLDDYSMISIKPEEMTDETYDALLKSFHLSLEPYQLQGKAKIYSVNSVRNAIMDDIKVLKNLNTLMNEEGFVLTEGEKHLFSNPDFLKSEFFKNKYVSLVCRLSTLHGKDYAGLEKGFSFLRDQSPTYQNSFFYLLGTFDFEDLNLSFYIQSILDQTKDPKAIDTLYQERLMDKEGGINRIGNSLYEILSSEDERQVEEYIKLLEYAPSNMDFNADTKIIYQRKLGKKK